MTKRTISFLLVLIMLLSALLTSCQRTDTFNDEVDPEEEELITAPWGSVSANISDELKSNRDAVLKPLDNDFRSRTAVTYPSVNGKSVTAYTFFRDFEEPFYNNPNFSQILLVYQAIRYKDKHPDEHVRVTVSSFHLSIYVAACLDPNNPEYGAMKNLFDAEYNSEGYYRLSYLLVEAAKKGIEVAVLAQTSAADTAREDGSVVPDIRFEQYYLSHLDDEAYIAGKRVSDYMTFRPYNWTSYGDKAAADMMHNKLCIVSHFTDNSGVDHESAFWSGSINLDGVSEMGQNGNNSVQTATVIVNHAELCRVAFNYTDLLADYAYQEEVVLFREAVITATTKQIDLINAGRQNEIPAHEQIVYLGTENDKIFELYFTPFGGTFSTWDTVYNPYSKYISKLLPSVSGDDYIELFWINVKYKTNFEYGQYMADIISAAFHENKNTENVLHLHLYGMDHTPYNDLIEGEDLAYKSVNEYLINYHTKDLQLSYVEDGQRYYVTVLNSLNFHEGSMYHQTNTVLVIKETDETGNDLYTDYGILTTPGYNFESRRVVK